MRSFVVVAGVLSGLSACAGLHLSSTDQSIDAPANVTATAVSDTQISVSWSAVPGAFKYFVFDKLSSDTSFVFAGTTLDPGTSQTVINLTPNTSYDFQVVTESTDGSDSGPSATATATTLAVPPGAPTNVTAAAVSNTEIDLSWTNFPTATKVFVFESVNGGANAFRATVLAPGSTFAATGLTANTTYCYQLQSTLPDGSESGLSTPPACATTGAGPQPPGVVTATAISDTRILVQWQAVASAAKYNVFQSQAGGPFTARGVAVAPSTEFLDVNLQPSTQYCYRVSTVLTDGGESAQSGQVCATTPATGTGGALEGYWKLDERGGTTAVDSSGFGRNGAITDAAYALQDRPNIDDDRSALSFSGAADSAITVPPASGFDLITASSSVAFWVKLPAAGSFRFIGSRAAGCGTPNWEIGQDATGLFFSRGDAHTAAGTSIPAGVWTHVAVVELSTSPALHFFVNGVEVSATDPVSGNFTLGNPLSIGHVAGCASDAVMMDDVRILSRALSAAELADIGTLPPAPANLVVTSTTSVSINLGWDAVPGATAYIVSKGTAPGNEQFFTHSPANPPTFEGDHLTPNSTFSWTVRTVAHGLFSNPSNEAIGTTQPPPDAPANVTATVIAPDRIQVSWSPVTAAVKYLVFESVGGGPFTFAASLVAPGTTFTAVNLSPATTYSFEVQSEDAVQTDGPLSAPASATTP
ncbi:MAG TPA: fibronectin type III domain-containing protein [Kofleriaceae bacterium]|nr:fibronectin type III domain-containing protein [Kofleriaceae bacterium]